MKKFTEIKNKNHLQNKASLNELDLSLKNNLINNSQYQGIVSNPQRTLQGVNVQTVPMPQLRTAAEVLSSPPQVTFQKPMKQEVQMFEPLNNLDEELQNITVPMQSSVQVETSTQSSEIESAILESDTDSYILFLDMVPICSGPKEEISEEVGSLLYGSHQLCQGIDVDVSRIVVLKKVNFYVGVNLD